MKFFMDKGWSREQASGIVANLIEESGLDPRAVGDGGAAVGVAQWHPDRQAEFERWAGKKLINATREEQYGFVHYEMTEGREQAAGRALRGAATPNQAGQAVSRRYERPKNADLEAVSRGNLAEVLARSSQGTALPYEAGPGRGSPESFGLKVDPIIVRHEGPNGQQIRPDQTVNTRVTTPRPFGH